MKKFFIMSFIFFNVVFLSFAKVSVDFTLGNHKNTYLFSVKTSKWSFIESVRQKENTFTFSNNFSIKDKTLPVSVYCSFPDNLEFEYLSQSFGINLEWTRKDKNRNSGFLRKYNSELSFGNNFLGEVKLSANDMFIKASAVISALIRERDALKVDSSMRILFSNDEIEVELKRNEKAQNTVRKEIVLSVCFPSFESVFSFEEGSDPIYGGTSRTYKIMQTNTFSVGEFIFETTNTADYQDDGGCLTETDFKIGFSCLTVETTLNRTKGAINGFSMPKVTFATDLCKLVYEKKKFKLYLEFRTENFSIVFNPNRTVSIGIDF